MPKTAAVIAALLTITPAALLAEEPEPFATLGIFSGTVAPEYAWSITLRFAEDGKVTRSDCKGYEKEGSACTITSGQATPDAIEAIRDATLASGLLDTPALDTDMPLIGGGGIQGSVVMDGKRAALISQPQPSDQQRVRSVLDAIGAAVPPEMQTGLDRN